MTFEHDWAKTVFSEVLLIVLLLHMLFICFIFHLSFSYPIDKVHSGHGYDKNHYYQLELLYFILDNTSPGCEWKGMYCC